MSDYQDCTVLSYRFYVVYILSLWIEEFNILILMLSLNVCMWSPPWEKKMCMIWAWNRHKPWFDSLVSTTVQQCCKFSIPEHSVCSHTDLLVIMVREISGNRWNHDRFKLFLDIYLLKLPYICHCVQTGTVAHSASYLMHTEDSSPRVKQLSCETDHLLPSNAEVKNTWGYWSDRYIFMVYCFSRDVDSCVL